MGKEAGFLPKMPTDSSLGGIHNPYKNLILTYESQRDSINGKKPTSEQFSLTFFESYINRPEVPKIIEKLIINGAEQLEYKNILQYLRSGLSNLAMPQKIPELSDYQRKDIANSFTRYFYLVVESISRISINNKPPSRSTIQLLIENPKCLEPNFYELFFNQIKHDGYYSKTNIFMALKESPKNAKERLENNNETFKTIITILKTHNSTRIINFLAIRRIVDREGEKAIDSVNNKPNNFYLTPRQAERKKRIDRLEQQKKELLKALSFSKISPISASIETRPRQISQPIFVHQPAEQIKKEELLATKLLSSHPIDHVSSKDLTAEQQQKIKELKDKNLNNSFAQDWVIEYYIINYPDNTEEKLKEDENKMVDWKHTLSKDFNDSWILKHFLIYYPNDYKNRYLEAKKAYSDLMVRFDNYEFAFPDMLKNIAVYYYENRINAVQKGILLLKDLKKEFFETELINKNPSNISRYIIRNFDNPVEDLRNATEQFNFLLKKATEMSGDFFHKQDETEISPGNYLRLLFEYHPIQPESSISNIKDVYQKLQTQFETDNFFGKYKKLALKKIAIISTEKSALSYNKLKRKIEKYINDPQNKGIDRDEIIRVLLSIPEKRVSISIEYLRAASIKKQP